MALRSLARGTLSPAASALGRSSGAGMRAPALSRFLGAIRNQSEQHSNGAPKETADESAFLLKELDKVGKALSQRDKEVEKLHSELHRVVKIYCISFVGISALGLFWK